MEINQIIKEVQSINPSATKEAVSQALIDSGVDAADVSQGEIPSIARRTQSKLAAAGNTAISPQAQNLVPTTESLPKTKRGKVAKSKALDGKSSGFKKSIEDAESSLLVEAAQQGYGSEFAPMIAMAYAQGAQLRTSEEIARLLPQAFDGLFRSISPISDDRFQGLFDDVQMESDEPISIDWSL